MKIVEQKETFNVANFDDLTGDSINIKEGKHGSLLPNTVRCIVSGPSNSGKTNVVFNLIVNPKGLRFNNIYLFSKSLLQSKYRLLDKILTDVKEVKFFKFNSSDSVMHPSKAFPHSVFIFDDVASENHNVIQSYFSMGRHHHIDSIYIGQTYSKIPKQLLRDNVNLLIVFKQDDTNLKHIYNDHVGCDMTFIQFKDICAKAWEEKYGFLVIDKDSDKHQGRYRLKFDHFVFIS